MIKSVEAMIDDLLRREGGFIDHPADRGGPTNYGITQRTLASYRGRSVSSADVRALTEQEARDIYRTEYLTAPQLHRIRDPYVLSLAFDCAVNHGPARTVRWLQASAGVIDDGIFGDATEVAVNTVDPVHLYNRLLRRRLEFYGSIISHDPELRRARAAGFNLQAEFALGWIRRACEFIGV